jgi:hypothetical protein
VSLPFTVEGVPMYRVASLFIVSFVLTTLAPPATAGAPSNCSFRLEPMSQDGATTTASPVLIGCYSTFEASVEAGFGGAVDVPSGTSPVTLDVDASGSVSTTAAADVLIGTEWTSVGYVGSSNSYFASSTCSSSQIWQVNYVGDSWNDKFESGKGFGGCDTNKKFEDADYGGGVLTCTPNCTGYLGLNNRVSSLRWKP